MIDVAFGIILAIFLLVSFVEICLIVILGAKETNLGFF